MSLNDKQPPPKPSDHPAVWDLVLADMAERDKIGRLRYGSPLQAFNGRDAIQDLTEELLDGIAYARQLKEELKCLAKDLRRLHVILAESQSLTKAGLADAVSLVESILRRNPALAAE